MYTFKPNETIKSSELNSNFSEVNDGGWLDGSNTYTYLSASTLSVPTADAAKMSVGTKLCITQTTAKYFYVYSISGTTVTIIINTNYTLVNAAITTPKYSNTSAPYGFPQWLSYTPSITGYSANPTNVVYRYRVEGRTVFLMFREATSGTSNATTTTYTAPATAATVTNMVWMGVASVLDNTAAVTTTGLATLASASATISIFKDMASAVWTASGGKRIATLTMSYEI